MASVQFRVTMKQSLFIEAVNRSIAYPWLHNSREVEFSVNRNIVQIKFNNILYSVV